jgi:RNA-directed DNA polymerase
MVSSLATNGLHRRLEDWNQINWKKVNKLVKNLRTRIFRARKLGDFRKLRSLQKLMLRSYAKKATVCSTHHSDKSWQSDGRN